MKMSYGMALNIFKTIQKIGRRISIISMENNKGSISNMKESMSNFEFLKKDQKYSTFTAACMEAEKSIIISNAATAILARKALELAVKWVYSFDEYLKLPYEVTLSTLIHDYIFKEIIDPLLFPKLRYIQKLGNKAVHSSESVTREQAVLALKNLYEFISWIDYCYSDELHEQLFNESILGKSVQQLMDTAKLLKLKKNFEERDRKFEDILLENESLRRQFREKREGNTQKRVFKADTLSEYQTRKMYIDLEIELNEWVFGVNCREEVEVQGMPNNAGVGFADYVLYGNDGKPLAVIEAKKTSVDPRIGEQQVKLYADCLEKQHGVRPIMFYTNGFDYYIWEDEHYPPRRISGLYTKEDLDWLNYKRKEQKTLEYIEINDLITNRYYQKEAIKAVCNGFKEKRRKALLVMATGSGKTRTAISVVDVLIKKGWVKNILFLADRTALVKQAKKNFKNLLPNLTLCNLLDKNDTLDSESRMIFSTYPTMMNAIDEVKKESGEKLFSRGHFDLIIIDESHRSIYKKYQDIFNYFDAMLLGLTATPKCDIDKNTFSVFELQDDEPTYSYELDQAIEDCYLVPYHTIETKMKFMEKGIHYDELSDKEKETFEDTFDDNVKDISGSALNKYLFNANTVDHVLQELMNKGLKVEGGDKLGKTIIFAKNIKHADFIIERFNSLYPKFKGRFARAVYTDIKYLESIMDNFSSSDKRPQIAISVDMLDTGIDIPEVLNLVFFKKIRSKTKFWQMIGRGTRLCEGLFGYGIDKTEFRIFDYCTNFDFFRVNGNGKEAVVSRTLTEKLFLSRIEIIKALQKIDFQDEIFQKHRKALVKTIIHEVQTIDKTLFNAAMQIKYIDKYGQISEFDDLTDEKLKELDEKVASLIPAVNDDEEAKKFDLLMYQIEYSLLSDYISQSQRIRVVEIAEKLSEKGSIEVVRNRANIIAEVQTDEFWEHPSVFSIERVRETLRDLVKFLDYEDTAIYYTNFTDEILETSVNTYKVLNEKKDYRKEVKDYIKNHKDNPVFEKIRELKPLTEDEISELEAIFWYEIGTKENFEKVFGKCSVINMLKTILGVERDVVEEYFSEFLNKDLNEAQTAFVNLVVDYIAENGSLERERLLESPFDSWGDLTKLFFDKVEVLKGIVERILELI
jgi:type I restriction enzyme R subunit